MTYSFTEKKRIRRQFGTLPNVMSLPYLIKTQTDSYAEFLQENLDPLKRENNGLEEVFKSIFPIYSANRATSARQNGISKYINVNFMPNPNS